MVSLESKRTEDILKLIIGFIFIIWVNILSSAFFERFDLTEEKRYTIKSATKDMLAGLEDRVYVEVYLEGELNASFERFQRSIRETLEEFRIYSNNKVQFTFIDPAAALTENARGEFMQDIMSKGIQPTRVIDEKDGSSETKLIFPGAMVSYGGAEQGVMLLAGNQAATAEEKINQSIEGVEYAIASAIYDLTSIERKSIGIVRGHDELTDIQIAGLTTELKSSYKLQEINLSNKVVAMDALIIAQPKVAFTEQEKYNLDQYVMSGGKVLLFMDKLQANMDSASSEANYSFPYTLNLDDQLFKYGVRVNNDLIQDNSAARYPINVGTSEDQSEIKLIKWWFYPIINRFGDHVITRNLDAVVSKFASTMDTIKSVGVKKTPLLFTSDYSRSMTAPVNVSIQDLKKNLTPEMLNQANLPIAYLLEGTFSSLYKNRFKPENIEEADFNEESSDKAKLLVVSDGDLIRNDINPQTGNPQPLGFDPFAQTTYANQDFILNALNYMLDENGLITARSKEIKIRPLDKVKISEERAYWQVINLVLPILALLVYGGIRLFLRKRKYTGFKTE